MDLNLYIIAEHLKEIPFERHLTADPETCSLTHLSCFLPDLNSDFQTLYIISAESLCGLGAHPKPFSFLCIGKPSADLYLNSGDQYLFFPEDTDMHRLLQEVQNIFLFFHQWEIQMYSLLCHRASLMELCEHCLLLTGNPLCLASSDLRILAYGERHGKPRELRLFSDADIGEYLSDEEIDAFRLDRDYVKGIESHHPCILNNDFFGFRHFYNNIFIDNIYVARIVICEVERPIRDGDYALLLKICNFFKLALENADIVLNNHPKNFDRLVERLLNGENISNEETEKVLSGIGWKHTGLYFCGIIESNLDRLMHSYQTLCTQLEKLLSGSMAVALNDHILLIINLESTAYTKKSIHTDLSPFIRENLLRAGLSNCFHYFSDLPVFVRQAQDTLHMGLLKDNTIWCYDFDAYALQILLERCGKGHKPEDLCLEKLQILIDYDKDHKRDYVNILKTYLQCNMSVAKAMKKLYVQRATLLYQLKRIHEISQIDLDDYQTRLYLMIYFAICDSFTSK